MKKIYYLLAVLIFLLFPFVTTSPYLQSLMILTGIFALLAFGLDLMFGYTGVVSFGHAAFFAIGAYITGILTERMEWSLAATIPFVIIGSTICGLLIGLATIRIGGIYFSLASLGFAEIIRLVALNWSELTHGPMGLVLNPEKLRLIGSIPLKGEMAFYYLVLITVLITIYFVYRMRKSWIGRALMSIRDNEPLASSIGISPVLYKVIIISAGGGIASIAGSYYGYYYGLITPMVSGVHYTTIALLAVMVGGRGTLAGPLLGAAIFALVPELIPGEFSDLIFGAILLIVILLSPNGLAPVLTRTFLSFRKKFNRVKKKEEGELDVGT
ncbi:branched-chain amino acid ABC transporter permease [Neobacillus mesonae]|uniref:branched-chain amino acid ABC transporter permease n=1 Tax=Neobacillus mesonae TaxID=1193713 RepID=UPI00203C028F|nr:branched-chain amino acid ABC transporter permease [Neobacillus mesonae]MCM3568241.1 branched-chain amino acid ABC transporter permease [Neobacillus mesonae]